MPEKVIPSRRPKGKGSIFSGALFSLLHQEVKNINLDFDNQ
jgi:hypothetical protein